MRWHPAPKAKWHAFFAWYPIRVRYDGGDGTYPAGSWVWLENVARYRDGSLTFYGPVLNMVKDPLAKELEIQRGVAMAPQAQIMPVASPCGGGAGAFAPTPAQIKHMMDQFRSPSQNSQAKALAGHQNAAQNSLAGMLQGKGLGT